MLFRSVRILRQFMQQLREELARRDELIALLQRQLFGRRSEKTKRVKHPTIEEDVEQARAREPFSPLDLPQPAGQLPCGDDRTPRERGRARSQAKRAESKAKREALPVIEQTIGELYTMARMWGLEFDVLEPKPVPWSLLYTHVPPAAIAQRYGNNPLVKTGASMLGDYWFAATSSLSRARIGGVELLSAYLDGLEGYDDILHLYMEWAGVAGEVMVRYAVMYFSVETWPDEITTTGFANLLTTTTGETLTAAFTRAKAAGQARAEIRLVFMDTDTAAGPVGGSVDRTSSRATSSAVRTSR